MDGAVHPQGECIPDDTKPGCRPRVIAYKGGETPGPHVFPRTRWNKAHSELLCSHNQFVACFDGGEHKGSSCVEGCGFVAGVDTQPQLLVANAFKARAALKNPDFILNAGDNFYWGGIEENCGSSMAGITATTRHQFDSAQGSVASLGSASLAIMTGEAVSSTMAGISRLPTPGPAHDGSCLHPTTAYMWTIPARPSRWISS